MAEKTTIEQLIDILGEHLVAYIINASHHHMSRWTAGVTPNIDALDTIVFTLRMCERLYAVFGDWDVVRAWMLGNEDDDVARAMQIREGNRAAVGSAVQKLEEEWGR